MMLKLVGLRGLKEKKGMQVGYEGKAEEGGEFAALQGHSQLPHSAPPRSERDRAEHDYRQKLRFDP
jgi:hypothetical protein